MADLQHEYMRVSRVADLSAGLSRENIAKAGHLTQRLNQVIMLFSLFPRAYQNLCFLGLSMRNWHRPLGSEGEGMKSELDQI